MQQIKKTRGIKSYTQTMRYVGLSFISLIVVLVSICVFSYIQATQVQQEYDSKVFYAYQRLKLVNDLFRENELSQALLTAHVLTQDAAKKDSLYQEMKQVEEVNKNIIDKLGTLLTQPEGQALLQSLEQDQANYNIHADSLLKLIDSNLLKEAQAYTRAYLAPFYSRYQAQLISLSNNIAEATKQDIGGFKPKFAFIVNQYALLLLLALAFAVGAAFILIRVFKRMHHENHMLNAEIRERMQLETALQESQRQYKALFNNNPLPMWVVDQQNYRFLEVNKAAQQEYGYTREEFLSKTIWDIRLESERAALEEQFASSDKNALAAGYWRHKRKDGSIFKVTTRSHRLPKHKDAHPRVVVAINVQEQVDILEKLEHSEKQLREISSSIPGAVYQFQLNPDRSFSFPFVSEGIHALVGIPAAEAIGRPVDMFGLLHPDDLAIMERSMMHSFRTFLPWELEFRVWHAGKGKYVWLRGHSLPTAKKDGSVYWNGTFIDITKQKEAQDQLTRSEANLRALLDSAPQAIFLLDQEINVITFNAVAAADIRRSQLRTLEKGQNLLEFIAAPLQKQVKDNHGKAMRGKAVFYEAGAGNYWHEIAYRPILAADNSVLAVSLTINDISDQKKAIKTIKRSEAQLARAQQLAHLGNWEYDLASETLSVSDGVYTILRERKGTFLPSRISAMQYIHPQDKDMVENKLREAVHSKKVVAFDHRIILKDGSERSLFEICELVSSMDGTPIRLSGSVQDITERVEAAREVTEAKNLLQSTLENIPEIIFSADASFKLTYISPQCREVTGYTEEEFLQNYILWKEALLDADKQTMLHKLVPNLLAGHRQQHEIRIQARNGDIRWLQLRLSPMMDEQGKVLRIDGSAADITQYKAEEAKRNELTDQLLKQNQNLQQFAYIVSHNLRAPIANILGLTSIYNRSQPDAALNQRVVDNLGKSAQLLDSTIRDLNELLTLRSELQHIQEVVYFEQVVQHALDSLAVQKGDAEVVIDFDAAPKIKTIRSYVQSIITNLISNAFKYRSPDRKLHLTLKTTKHSDYICLTVSDNGLGLDLAKTKDKLFGLYKRFHPGIEGKGLGLHLVKTQAELLNGKVEVKSQLGVGTTFNIYFKN
ncbi:PAS domain S-box protein [Pontibacter sp. 172403-2]|uniref:PAS domain S-box protein n=1 Tax=Pontibacter rufus TaxID=2791028 RepID=UPI0018AFFFF7|nr:PAS domain S-box protein [Pontibacter sp. 172403-2]MBF9254508.1 PAS domain S-box protein [Pontibacter sp. 172403-2]